MGAWEIIGLFLPSAVSVALFIFSPRINRYEKKYSIKSEHLREQLKNVFAPIERIYISNPYCSKEAEKEIYRRLAENYAILPDIYCEFFGFKERDFSVFRNVNHTFWIYARNKLGYSPRAVKRKDRYLVEDVLRMGQTLYFLGLITNMAVGILFSACIILSLFVPYINYLINSEVFVKYFVCIVLLPNIGHIGIFFIYSKKVHRVRRSRTQLLRELQGEKPCEEKQQAKKK